MKGRSEEKLCLRMVRKEETMDVSEEEVERERREENEQRKREKKRERKRGYLRRKRKVLRFRPSDREKARGVHCGWIKHLTQLYKTFTSAASIEKGRRKKSICISRKDTAKGVQSFPATTV